MKKDEFDSHKGSCLRSHDEYRRAEYGDKNGKERATR